jgi:hypothetical protein
MKFNKVVPFLVALALSTNSFAECRPGEERSVVKYFLSDDFSSEERGLIRSAMKFWGKRLCLSTVPKGIFEQASLEILRSTTQESDFELVERDSGTTTLILNSEALSLSELTRTFGVTFRSYH